MTDAPDNPAAPTHYCVVCAARWINHADDTWSVQSPCGPCCDNVVMGKQIVAIDYADDWMNPPPRVEYIRPERKYPRFLVLRERRLDHPPYREWAEWQCFDTAAERNKALELTRAAHPAWNLKTRNDHYAPLSYN